ncbi:hypothetical protein GE061_000014 [Apolygus lucorum]|uniref:Uncharacterized protein n=1 Tax=Apolygus lucorum TaxID=248454 RepID=A0A8S9Y3D4_APOLU|nr:hypothetical protein GE061_000014 [Apolygus lucorum]
MELGVEAKRETLDGWRRRQRPPAEVPLDFQIVSPDSKVPSSQFSIRDSHLESLPSAISRRALLIILCLKIPLPTASRTRNPLVRTSGFGSDAPLDPSGSPLVILFDLTPFCVRECPVFCGRNNHSIYPQLYPLPAGPVFCCAPSQPFGSSKCVICRKMVRLNRKKRRYALNTAGLPLGGYSDFN